MKFIGGDTALWKGGLTVGRRGKSHAHTDAFPVAVPDAAVVVAGGSVTIAVLGNDTDPEGGALTLTGASVDQGSVAANADGTLLYTAPSGFAGLATITYAVADPAGNVSEGTAAVEVMALSVTEGETAGEFVVGAAPGTLSVTVIAPAEDAGEYVLQTADLASGPVNLRPPRISGAAEAGAELTALPGLWAFDETGAPLALARQWMRGTTPIAGQTGTTYVVDATADAGHTLCLVETAEVAAGTRAAQSTEVPVPVPAAPVEPPSWSPAMLPGLALWLDASDAETVTLSGSEVSRLADKSGHGRHAVRVDGAPAPTLEADLDGKPVLRFPDGAHLRTADAALPGLPGMPGITVIAVTQGHLAEPFRKCVTLRNDVAASGQYMSVQTGLSMMWFGNGNRYWAAPAPGPVVAVARYPEAGSHDAAEWWRNGGRLAETATGKPNNSVSLPADACLQLGSDNSPSSDQAECCLVVGALSEDDRQKAEGYLAHKWGLADQLPDTHPHKARPPVA